MNKYTMADIKIGDYFLHLEEKSVYKLLSIDQQKYKGNLEWQYKFLDMKTKQEWIQTRKWFMKNLMPAPRATRILYNEEGNEI